jgi:hypothetical protein
MAAQVPQIVDGSLYVHLHPHSISTDCVFTPNEILEPDFTYIYNSDLDLQR